jgi:hypothetical protein
MVQGLETHQDGRQDVFGELRPPALAVWSLNFDLTRRAIFFEETTDFSRVGVSISALVPRKNLGRNGNSTLLKQVDSLGEVKDRFC